ncbi:MAG: DUF502 domain-containing protein [Proteobacteria bacterium]|nr:DUF502 domain-containing protein [Pseudomonadota bacterium]
MMIEEEKIVNKPHDDKPSLLARIRKNFVAGLFILMPVVLTLWIFKTIIFSIDRFFQSFLPFELIQKLTVRLDNPIFQSLTGESFIPGLGLLFGFITIAIVGSFTKNVIGHKMIRFWDGLFAKMPMVSSIYSAIKQIVHTISSSRSASFREVVLVEYPRKDVWVLAFVSGNTTVSVRKHLAEDEEYINVFVPTTPNPTSGFLIFVPRSEVKKLNMTVEQGLKLVISAGIVSPLENVKDLGNK